MPLTEEQRRKYLENPNRCPYCGKDDIEGGSIEIDAGGASQEVSCLVCDEEWTDQYTLSDVTTED